MTVHATSSGERLPWPQVWPRPISSRQILASVFMVGVTALSIIGGPIALKEGDGGALITTIASPVIAALTLQVLVTQLRGRRRHPSAIRLDEVDALPARGLVIRYAGVQAVAWVIALAANVLAAIALSALLLLAGLTEPRVWALAAAALVPVSWLVYMLLFAVRIAQGRLARGLVALTPTGIYHRAWAYQGYVPWEAVSVVTPRYLGYKSGREIYVAALADPRSWFRRTSRLWKQAEYEFRPHLALPTQAFPVDPAVLLHGVRFYAENPGYRVELADERAVHRFQSGSFPVQYSW